MPTNNQNFNLRLDYIDFKEFLYRFFDLDFEPLSIASVLLQLTFICWLLYQFYKRFRGTQAERVLRGLIFLSPLILLCYALKLSIITKLIEIFSPTILIALVVIFAPEFRRVLMQLGGNVSLTNYLQIVESKKSISEHARELVSALDNLHRNKTGALVVIEQTYVDRYYINPGYPINANFSKELLLTMLNPKTPLHDGAIIIRGFTIVAAAVILPMTENPKLDWQYGTRHRAAIGFSEVTDSLCIVVSEETGNISIAFQGKINQCNDLKLLKEQIEKFYTTILKSNKKSSKLRTLVTELFNSRKKTPNNNENE